MTKNQIEYLKHKETQRSNMVNEHLTKDRDATNRELGFENLGENRRHNLATEQYNYAVLGENQRHNMAQESHNAAVLGETVRSNKAKESIEQSKLAETQRHNKSQEQISLDQLQISRDTLAESIRHSQAMESETKRANVARENETARSNLARETETHRSNTANEAQRRAELAETQRYHGQQISLGYANVNLGYSQLAEAERSHRANEALGQSQLDEQIRTHLRNEQLTDARDQMNFELGVLNSDRNYEYNQIKLSNEAAQLEEMSRHNQVVEDESRRHNQATESISTSKEVRDWTNTGVKLIPLFLG